MRNGNVIPLDTASRPVDGSGMTSPRLSTEAVRAILDESRIFERLEAFDPRWVGSIPLDIHGPGADADICCSAHGDLDGFEAFLRSEFGGLADASISPNRHAGEASVITKFSLGDLPVEIYGRSRPVETHESYVHWLAEHRLLQLAEERLREDVRVTKVGGLKTEPAFAEVLGLGGDPFIEVLKLASPSDDALKSLLRGAGYALR